MSTLNDLRKVHFIGIGGYGMSALALILLQAGFDVRGSDLNPSKLVEILKKSGAKVFIGHREEQLGDAELVVYSTAIPADNPELKAAEKLGLPLWHRSELLAFVLNRGHGIAIAGTHGKTTTTAMLSLILEKAGVDPTAIIGGEVPFFGGNARLGKSEYIVAEACESDHSFLRYKPYLALVTNIEADHLEHYDGDFNKMVETYRIFINNVKEGGTAVVCGDDPILSELRLELCHRIKTYGLGPENEIRGERVELQGLASRFQVWQKDQFLGEVVLKVPGLYNVLNALGAIAVALLLGIKFSIIKKALLTFTGAKRRFECIGEIGGIVVIDDYAHHPTEVKATLEAARKSGKRLICIFQPHRYTRTKYLWKDFLEAFDEADILILDSIYSAGEASIPNINSFKLGLEIRERGHKEVHVIPKQEEIIHFLENTARPGDMIITMGAGDIWKVSTNFYQRVLSTA
ncbi:MAG: UDP-N-acetylmuramate--L-alanine ligase [Dethiobacteria bacterium]